MNRSILLFALTYTIFSCDMKTNLFVTERYGKGKQTDNRRNETKVSCSYRYNPRLRHAVRYSYDLVYTSSTSLLSSTFVLLSPHAATPLFSRLFFFLDRAVLRGWAIAFLESGRSRDSTSNLEQGRPNAVDNVNWWAGRTKNSL